MILGDINKDLLLITPNSKYKSIIQRYIYIYNDTYNERSNNETTIVQSTLCYYT